MTIDHAMPNDVTLDVTASIATAGSKVDYVLDDECGYVLDIEAFLPDSHDVYAQARALLDRATSTNDIELDVPNGNLAAEGFMLAPADSIDAAEVDEYDYDSQVMYALDDEHGFVIDEESRTRDSVEPAPASRVRSTAKNNAFVGRVATV